MRSDRLSEICITDRGLVSVIVVFWHDGGPGLGMLATISGAIVIWKEGPWKKAK